ncbi:hypothetical protein HHI36_009815 [Cryptolaemus montrouzieri]|uniref:C-CAP/cofactor C-like domain-containing protein n=1 Tax=Cryptolaemus montrouzieri TaxID=559131 RepID=A0ABD2MGV5_9CUCU
MDTVDDRIGVIAKRDHDRKLNIQIQKNIKESRSAKNENIDFFGKEFSDKCADIEDLLNRSASLSKTDLPNHFNDIFKDLLILQKYVAASNIFLRSYDIKRCNEALNTLTNRAKELEDELLPKKKFGFKNKSKLATENNMNDKGIDQPDFSQHAKKTSFDDESNGFSGKSNEVLCLKENEVFKKDVTIHHMTNCTVRIFGTPSTLHLNALNNCTILSGPVSTSIFASNCENCILVIACQQLRLHSSKDVKIYLHVTSRAIMEDCTDISISPYNFKYEGIQAHFQQSGLDVSINNWQGIDDFNWLKLNEHSPNWKVLDESERKESWD